MERQRLVGIHLGWPGLDRRLVERALLDRSLVDRLHVAIVPILLGRGIRLWDDLRGLEEGYTVTSEVAPSGVTHLTFAR